MISTQEALTRILQTVAPRPSVELPLELALGGFLAEDVRAAFGLPLFDNSAMDGYAVRAEDLALADNAKPVRLQVVAIIAAGDNPAQAGARTLTSGETMQIFTGAMIPPGADTVVPQEDVQVYDSSVSLSAPPRPGLNIRRAGEELRKGDIVMRAGERVTPAAVGLLASFGLRNVTIIQRPCVGCITTGSELIPAGRDLAPGQIYDSNSAMLCAAVAEMGLAVGFRTRSGDDRDALFSAIKSGLAACDVLLVSGGVSVGAYDYVKYASAAAGIQEIFWKVAQKPGKPIYFGASADRSKLLFGLPGNPASALTCFYEYVRPALRNIMGSGQPEPVPLTAKLATAYSKRAGMTHFLKGHLFGAGEVEILERQGSHMMSSFAQANCLIIVPPDITELQKGDQVIVHLLTP